MQAGSPFGRSLYADNVRRSFSEGGLTGFLSILLLSVISRFFTKFAHENG
jgi:hypothetical protein